MNLQEENLDYFIAKSAMELFESFSEKEQEKSETVVQKATSVLSSQGLFAMFLWSFAKDEYKPVAKAFIKILPQFVDELKFDGTKAKDVLAKLKETLKDFNSINLLENLAMKILIYARHYCKSVKTKKE